MILIIFYYYLLHKEHALCRMECCKLSTMAHEAKRVLFAIEKSVFYRYLFSIDSHFKEFSL
jgi:hypothetical protein